MTPIVLDLTAKLQPTLERQCAVHTARLAELTSASRQPDLDGYDPDTLHGLIASSRRALAQAAEALRRMADGTYGGCETCGEAIAAERLEAVPHARFCVRCQGRKR